MQQRTRKIKIAYEDSIGESLEARTGIVSAGNTGSSDSESSKDGDKLFFRVNNVKFHDLHDFAQNPVNHSNAAGTKLSGIYKRKTTGQVVKLNKKEIAIFRYGQSVFAIDEKCPHVGGPLHLGDIEKVDTNNTFCVICPWHKWKIDLENGDLIFPQRRKQTGVYPVRVTDNGDLLIGFDEFSPTYFQGSEDF